MPQCLLLAIAEPIGHQTERVISERVPASGGEARAPGMSKPREPSTTHKYSWLVPT